MSVIIDRQAVVADSWLTFDGDAHGLTPNQPTLVPIEEWIEHTVQWHRFASKIGIILCQSDDPMRLASHLDDVSMVGLICMGDQGHECFVSHIHQLRNELGYLGTIRALGPLRCEQVPSLAKNGCDEFELADEQEARQALALVGGRDA